MSKLFHTVLSNAQVGNGTAGDLINWLEAYVNVLMPNNGVEYWSDNRYGRGRSLKQTDRVPSATATNDEDRVDHAACYVIDGCSEGRIVHIVLFMRDGSFIKLAWIKTFGQEAECWQIARAVSVALNSLLRYGELPRLVEFAAYLPKRQRWDRATTLEEEVIIQKGGQTLTIATYRTVLAQYDLSVHGAAAPFYFDALIEDWKIVLTNMKARWRLVEDETSEIMAPDLQGYRITNRATGITGFYVLPPGANALDDREWLGYYPSSQAAVDAARQHKASQAAA